MFNAASSFGKLCVFALVMTVIMWQAIGFLALVIWIIPLKLALHYCNALERRDLEDYYDSHDGQ